MRRRTDSVGASRRLGVAARGVVLAPCSAAPAPSARTTCRPTRRGARPPTRRSTAGRSRSRRTSRSAAPGGRLFGDPALNALEARGRASRTRTWRRRRRSTARRARSCARPPAPATSRRSTVGLGYTRSRDVGDRSSGTAAPTRARLLQPSIFQLPPRHLLGAGPLGPDPPHASSRAGPSAQASAGDLEAARLSFQAELAQDYFQLRTLDAQKQLLDETVAAYEQSLELTRNRYASGVASQADVAAGRDPAQDDPGAGDRRRRAARAARARHRAARRQAAVDLLAPGVAAGGDAARHSRRRCPSELLERRPDIAAAERRVAAANAQIGVAVAAYYPTVTLSAVGGLRERRASPSGSRGRAGSGRSGPGISQTVFDGGLRGAQTDEARAAYDATVAALSADRAGRVPGGRGQPGGAPHPARTRPACRTRR